MELFYYLLRLYYHFRHMSKNMNILKISKKTLNIKDPTLTTYKIDNNIKVTHNINDYLKNNISWWW